MLKKFCKGLGLLVTAGMLLLQGAGIAEAGVLKVGDKNTTYISMATIERNKVLVVAGNPNDKEKLDKLWIMEL